ncbi:hypothetical protein MAPG_11161 [Magnaporthiopsis poae ATCC 64411]|uniref:CBM1 domain-containing protein n=1 Tax=Magnaporthiopsis poae (strain ATCC 64411 / 73-15) TaxID=644358 RepID=A0A0C4EEI8_MAGP6|nr:hypothetical protein MAPG_11161 [Magnaporthiopsis poae ATCC 64411]
MRFLIANALAGAAYMASAVAAGTVIWDGRFNDLTSATDLNKWSWSSQVGPYQYYIHGSSPVTSYVNLSPSYKNPADTASRQGAKFTLDSTAYWNGQNMRRIELIPQTSAAINKGKVFYHFSIKRSNVNPPATTREHQIAFFESHFTELKSGWLSGAPGTSDPALRWMVNQQTKWSVDWAADVWHNVAYEIDFSANTVGFYVFSAWTQYKIRKGGGSGTSLSSTSTKPTAPATPTSMPTTTPPPATTSNAPSQPGQTKYGQCGGGGYSGPTSCIDSTCTALNQWCKSF